MDDSDPPDARKWHLPINELFETIQGEGGCTGWPAVFVRLQGCPVGCPWCDTRETWHVDPRHEIPFDAMVAKTTGQPSFSWAAPRDLFAWVMANTKARHVVITGGEPTLYDLTTLSGLFLDAGRTVQIETSGTHEIKVDPRAIVTVSPKVGMPGGLAVLPEAMARADEIKMPVGKPDDVVALQGLVRELMAAKDPRLDRFPTIWLQPISQSHKATDICIEAATACGWRVSIQTHKYLGVR
jgi:7-carboxy-7-deazaguanine synthase